MKRTMTFWISTRIARRWGTRAAAVAGWVYAYARKAALDAGAEDGKGRGWVRASQEQIARDLHLCRQTVAKILRTLTQEDILVAANFYTGSDGAERLCEATAEPAVKATRREPTASVKGTRREPAATHKGKQVGHRLGKANRGYTIGSRGYRMMRLNPRQWHVAGEEALLCCGGIDTGVASRVGVNAAIVFQHLWFWSHAWRRATPSKTTHPPTADAWLPYTAAEIARWLPFLSDDVIEDALHTLEAEGLLVKSREGKVTRWSIEDAGYVAMGKMPPARYADAAYMGKMPPVRGVHSGSASWTAAATGAHEAGRASTHSLARMQRVSLRETSTLAGIRIGIRAGGMPVVCASCESKCGCLPLNL